MQRRRERNNNHVLFIIEGYNDVTNGLHPHEAHSVNNTIRLAKRYQVQVADTIHRFSPKTLADALMDVDVETHKVMVLCAIKHFNIDFNVICHDFIKPAYELLVANFHINKIPEWILGLPKMLNYKNFYHDVLESDYNNDTFELDINFRLAFDCIICQMNKMSKANTIHFLKTHPEITEVYALVCERFSPFLYEGNEEPDRYYSTLLNINDRLVNTYVIGVFENDDCAYKNMKHIFKKNLLAKGRADTEFFQQSKTFDSQQRSRIEKAPQSERSWCPVL